jgi:hypothetical protein
VYESERTPYSDPRFDFPHIKISAGTEISGVDPNGIYVREEDWLYARCIIENDGAAAGSSSSTSSTDCSTLIGATESSTLVWEKDGLPVWRRVDDISTDMTIFADLDEGQFPTWRIGEGAETTSSIYWAFYVSTNPEFPAFTWFSFLTNDDPTPLMEASEEVYDQGLYTLSPWVVNTHPVWRKLDNPEVVIVKEEQNATTTREDVTQVSDEDTVQDNTIDDPLVPPSSPCCCDSTDIGGSGTFGSVVPDRWSLQIFQNDQDSYRFFAAADPDGDRFPCAWVVDFYGNESDNTTKRPVVNIFDDPVYDTCLVGTRVWKHKDREMYIYRDTSPWNGWHGWFIGSDLQHNFNYYSGTYTQGVTDLEPPSLWEVDYYGTSPAPTSAVYPLLWELNGRPIFRRADNPAYLVYRGRSPLTQFLGWWNGLGYDVVSAAYWAYDNIKPGTAPAVWYTDFWGTDDPPTGVFQEYVDITESQVLSVLREPGVEHFTTASTDTITDTDSYHQVFFSWANNFFEGEGKLFIDGSEVSAYSTREAFTGKLAYLDLDTLDPEFCDEAGLADKQWANFNIGRTEGVYTSGSGSSSSSSSATIAPGYYFDGYLDEVMYFASNFLDFEVEALYSHLIEGVQDGDRWYIDDPDLTYNEVPPTDPRFPAINKISFRERKGSSPTGEWSQYGQYFAEWRRSPVDGAFGWVYLPVEVSGVFWNRDQTRLESWLPDEYFEKWGDYGLVGTGSFRVG